jgi:hypothetical protein
MARHTQVPRGKERASGQSRVAMLATDTGHTCAYHDRDISSVNRMLTASHHGSAARAGGGGLKALAAFGREFVYQALDLADDAHGIFGAEPDPSLVRIE